MSDQVEITNIGGSDGVASEATLQSLLKSIDKIAKQQGTDSKKAINSLKNLADQAAKSTEAIKDNSEEIEENTKKQKKYSESVDEAKESVDELVNALDVKLIHTINGLNDSFGNLTTQISGIDFESTDEFANSLGNVSKTALDLNESLSKVAATLHNQFSDALSNISSIDIGDTDEFDNSLVNSSHVLDSFSEAVVNSSQVLNDVTFNTGDIDHLVNILGSTLVSEIENTAQKFKDLNTVLKNYFPDDETGNDDRTGNETGSSISSILASFGSLDDVIDSGIISLETAILSLDRFSDSVNAVNTSSFAGSIENATRRINQNINDFDVSPVDGEVDETIDVITRNRRALGDNTGGLGDNTDAVNDSTSAFRDMSSSITGAILGALGAVAGSAGNLTKELIFGRSKLSSFTQHLPLLGKHLSGFTGYIDDSFDSFRKLSAVGASFNNNLNELRRTSAQTYLSLEQFTSFVTDNSDKLASFGGTVTNGTRELVKMQQGLGDNRDMLLNMGYTFEEINDSLSHYMYLNRAGSRLEQQKSKEQAAIAADYAKNLKDLSKLTGDDVDALKERIRAEQDNVSMQRALAQMTEGERNTFQETFASVTSISSSLGNVMKDFALDLGPLSEESRALSSGATSAFLALRDFQQGIEGGEISIKNRKDYDDQLATLMGDLVQGLSDSSQNLEEQLAIANQSGGELGGPAATLGKILDDMGISFSQIIDENGKVQRQKLDDLIASSREESDALDNTVSSMAEFDKAINETRKTLKVALVDSGIMDLFASGVETIAEFITSDSFQGPLQDFVDRLTLMTSTVSSFLSIGDWKGAMNALFVTSGPIASKIEEYMSSIGEMLRSSMSSMFEEDGAFHGFLSDAMGGIGSAISDAFVSAINNNVVVSAIAGAMMAVFAGPVVIGAVKKMIGSLFGGGDDDSRGGSRGRSRFSGGMGKSIKSLGTGLAASGRMSKYIVMGGGAIGAAIALIGAGIAGAAWITGKALPSFAEGLKSITEVDGDKLKITGDGLKSFGIGMAAFAGSQVANSFASVTSLIADGIHSLFGADRKSPIEQLERFTKSAIDVSQVQNNARAMVIFAETMNGLDLNSDTPGFIGTLRNAFSSLMGQDSNPMEDLSNFASYQIDQQRVTDNARSLIRFSAALKETSNIDVSEFKIDSFGSDNPFEELLEFSKMDIDSERIVKNSLALSNFADAIVGMKNIGDVSDSLKDLNITVSPKLMKSLEEISKYDIDDSKIRENMQSVASIGTISNSLATAKLANVHIDDKSFVGIDSAISYLNKFSGYSINSQKISDNMEVITDFEKSIRGISDIQVFSFPITGEMGETIDKISNVMDRFGKKNINAKKISENSNAMAQFAKSFEAISNIENLQGIGDRFNSFISKMLGEGKVSISAIQNFQQYDLDTDKIKKNAMAFVGFASAMQGFSKISSIDTENQDDLMKSSYNSLMVLDEFSKFKLDTDRIDSNARSMLTFGSVISKMGDIDSSSFSIDSSLVNELDKLVQTVSGIDINPDNMKAFGVIDNMGNKLNSLASVDDSGLKNYNSTIKELVETLGELNVELRNMEELPNGSNIPGINKGNTSTQSNGNVALLLEEVVRLLKEDSQLSKKIEKNTRSISTNNLTRNVTSL